MGAPTGNTNAAKGRFVYEAFRKAIAQDDKGRIAKGIQAALDDFAAGDPQARVFVRDTLDGKPAQAIALSGEDGGPIAFEMIKRVIVDPKP